MWQKRLAPYLKSGKLVAIGVVQEQHAERARLYRQWRQLDWPIAVDSLNLLDHRAVPIPMGLDTSGVIRRQRLRPDRFEMDFMERDFPDDDPPRAYTRVEKPDLVVLQKRAERGRSSTAWRDLGDALFLYGGPERSSDTVEAYRRAVRLKPADGRAHFRLGVALRQRYESTGRRPLDAQDAVESWGLALAANPGQYIWRRRIQQYGPRLDKPYNFYFWVETARRDIRARGEQPLPLLVEPTGSEISEPRRARPAVSAAAIRDLDPAARIPVDGKKLVTIESVVSTLTLFEGAALRLFEGHREGGRSRQIPRRNSTA